jgi:hypothetical protein
VPLARRFYFFIRYLQGSENGRVVTIAKCEMVDNIL